MRRPYARAIMLQATGSHAGKTVLVAGLCRLLTRRGLRVAPFKSQNMSLNAYVAADGGEMGWAQAMQAEAARVPARVEMNPILLKPRAEARSQVVLLGRVLGDTDASAYYRLTPTLWPAVRRSYETLARGADVIVIEGAGSPAEPNLMRRDLANMRVARLTRAPVLLVGDIDRGGVFASLVGTMALLPPADRRRVRGFVINKFRGDESLLAPAVRDLIRRTRVPVVGVVPFLPGLRLPEEDSVGLDRAALVASSDLRVAVVRLPHIANFTDFAPLEDEFGVRLVYAESPHDLAGASLVILPGSKDTIADLRALRARGFGPAIDEHHRRGGCVLGICGGYQMLGQAVSDPHRVESGGAEPGLGLLPVATVLTPEKITRRVRARWLPGGRDFEGYEIHMGETTREGARPLLEIDGRPEGCVSADGRVWGSYLHGLFEEGTARRHVLDWARRVGASGDGPPAVEVSADHRARREMAYERLADTLAACLDTRVLRELGAA
jgi:adenosylcobyric acid synthase